MADYNIDNMNAKERMLDLLLAQFKDKPVIKALIEVIGEEFDIHTEIKRQLRDEIWPDTAVGKQLDICGEVADIPRRVNNALAVDFFGFPDHGNNSFGQTRFRRYGEPYLISSDLRDNEYRLAIYSKIEKNNTDCSRVATIRSIKKMFKVNRIVAVNAGNAKIRVGIGRTVSTNELNLINELDLIIRAAGVGIIYVFSFDGTQTFGFTRNGRNIGNFLGFGEGSLARVLRIEGGLIY